MRKLQLLAGIAISALALFIVLRDVEWSEVLDRIQEANDGLLALAALILVATVIVRTLRWRAILRRDSRVRLWHLYGSINVMYFLNNLLPLQVGDLGRAYLLSELAGVSMTRTLSTQVVERVFDVLTLLAVLLFLALFIDVPSDVRAPSIILAAVFGSLAAGLLIAASRRERALSIADRLLRIAPAASRPKLQSMTASAVDGLAGLSDYRTAAFLLSYSAAIWLSVGLVVYTCFQAFDLPLGYGPALFIVVATTFGFFVPSTPGSFGVYHAIVIAVLTNVFDIEKSSAVSFALVVHLIFYLPPMVIGPAFLWLERDLWRQSSFWTKLRELRGAPIPEATPQ
ncbi:MAG TPA: lysylphosphatidylglycerol synthase transmembrane domain-containing protein [Dehalococcoidia bacterium]|nr:lysylphosphatidylglycerol synthase transmembrane domain-containing protein [Dehalococcoidia bacterium]